MQGEMAVLENRRYYTISEFARRMGVPEYVLRYWESVFPQLKPYKTEKGHRRYTDDHVSVVAEIKELMWEKKYTIEGARKALRESGSRRPAQFDLSFDGMTERRTLDQLKAALEEIEQLLAEE